MPFDTASLFARTATPKVTPFPSAERAWLWAAECLAARRDGKPIPPDATKPCTPDTIVKCLDEMYRNRMIDLVDAQILRKWGDRGYAPNCRQSGSRSDWQQWRHALAVLEHVLRRRGIVAGFDFTLPAKAPERPKNLGQDRITFTFKPSDCPATTDQES